MEYAHVSSFEPTDNGSLVFKYPVGWRRVQAKAKVTYQMGTETPDAGTITKETISLVADCDDITELINRNQYYILRLFTSDGFFVVGSLNYPARKTVSSDKSRAIISFECTSPL